MGGARSGLVVLAAVAAFGVGAARAADRPALSGSRQCAGLPGFTCSVLRVPLDRGGHAAGTLKLRVAAANNLRAPRGVLLFLTGGPGQPGVPFVERLSGKLGPAVLRNYRFVMFDQRGTGGTALLCPALQRAMGSSDLRFAPATVITGCAASLGPRRRFYTTADTVADVEALRRALGAKRLTLDGVSYGTFVAERYALAHPNRVARLVLDSVVPQDGADPLQRANMAALGRILKTACRSERCGFDPVAELARLVRSRGDGPALLDMLVTYTFIDPSYAGALAAIHDAAGGMPDRLDGLIAGIRRGDRPTAAELSQGLHASTICADMREPWGSSAAPRAGRAAALDRTVARLGASSVYPFDRATALDNGLVQLCLHWPPTPPLPSAPRAKLPPVPVLLLAGDRDPSTPLAWARRELADAPRGRLVVVAGAGHSVQSRAANPAGRRAVVRFLTGS